MTIDPTISLPLDEVLERSDLLILSPPRTLLRRARDRAPGRRHLGNVRDRGPSCEATGLGHRHGVQRGGSHRHLPRPAPRLGHAALRDPGRVRLARRHDGALGREVPARRPPCRPRPQHLRSRSGPGHPLRLRPRLRRRGGGDDGRRLRRPDADRLARSPGRAGGCGRRGLALHARGAARSEGPCSRARSPGWPGSPSTFWPGWAPGRHQLLQGLFDEFVRSVGIESDAGFEVGIELVAKARRRRLPVAEIPTIWLDRVSGQSNFKLRKWLPQYLRGTATPSGRGCLEHGAQQSGSGPLRSSVSLGGTS